MPASAIGQASGTQCAGGAAAHASKWELRWELRWAHEGPAAGVDGSGVGSASVVVGAPLAGEASGSRCCGGSRSGWELRWARSACAAASGQASGTQCAGGAAAHASKWELRWELRWAHEGPALRSLVKQAAVGAVVGALL